MCLIGSTPVHARETQAEVDKSRQLLREQMEIQLREQELAVGEADTEDLAEQIPVRRKPKAWTWTLMSDIGEIWSSNIFLDQHHHQSGFALTHNDAAIFSWKPADDLLFNGAYRYSIYRYHRLIAQNFDAYNATANLTYSLPYDISVYSGVGWTTVYSRPIDDSVYEEGYWNIVANKVIPLNFAS